MNKHKRNAESLGSTGQIPTRLAEKKVPVRRRLNPATG